MYCDCKTDYYTPSLPSSPLLCSLNTLGKQASKHHPSPPYVGLCSLLAHASTDVPTVLYIYSLKNPFW